MAQIRKLVIDATINAHKHGWFVVWDRNSVHFSNPEEKILTVGEALALCHSELSEALDECRDNDKEKFSEEIADEFIRLFHLCGDLNIDIETAIHKKMDKNKNRPKHHGRVNY